MNCLCVFLCSGFLSQSLRFQTVQCVYNFLEVLQHTHTHSEKRTAAVHNFPQYYGNNDVFLTILSSMFVSIHFCVAYNKYIVECSFDWLLLWWPCNVSCTEFESFVLKDYYVQSKEKTAQSMSKIVLFCQFMVKNEV